MHLRRWLAIGVLVLSMACGSDGSDNGDDLAGFFAENETEAMFLQWTRTDDDVSGTVSMASLVGSQVEQDSASFDGVLNDGSVTLTFEHGFGMSTNWNGGLDGDRLTLSYNDDETGLQTVTLRSAELAEFRDTVQAFERDAVAMAAVEQRAASDAAQAQQEAAQHAAAAEAEASDRRSLSGALTTMETAIGRMAGALGRLESDDLAAVREDLATTQEEANVGPMDSYQADAVRYAAESVAYSRDGARFTVEEMESYWTEVQDAADTVESLGSRFADRQALDRREAAFAEGERLRSAAQGLLAEADRLVGEAQALADAARRRAEG
jgi:hypothetical protein